MSIGDADGVLSQNDSNRLWCRRFKVAYCYDGDSGAIRAQYFLALHDFPFITIYQLYGNKSIAIFISISKSVAPMACMWLLSETAPEYIWWGLALGQVATAVFVMLYAVAKRSRDKRLARLTLVPRNEMLDGFETSIIPDIHAMSRLLDETDAFLKARIADSAVVFAIEVCSEELLKNIITYGYVKYDKRRYIDYRLSIMSDYVCVVISDDAKAFNPIGHSSKTGYGLQLLHVLCKEFRYDYLFHQNIVKINFAYNASSG